MSVVSPDQLLVSVMMTRLDVSVGVTSYMAPRICVCFFYFISDKTVFELTRQPAVLGHNDAGSV